MAQSKKEKIIIPVDTVKSRKKWSRSPVQKPHSTKKGEKGYDRKVEKAKMKKELRKKREE